MLENKKPKLEANKRYNLKIILCGSGAVGKTSLIRRFVQDKFEHNYLMTIGMDPTTKKMKIGNADVDLVIYDVAGQERFQFLREVFFKGAHGALLVFDLTRPEQTLDDLESWKEQIDRRLGEIPIVLLGNKCDLKEPDFDQSMVDATDDTLNFIEYMEVSALTGNKVNEAFELLTKSILQWQKIPF